MSITIEIIFEEIKNKQEIKSLLEAVQIKRELNFEDLNEKFMEFGTENKDINLKIYQQITSNSK